MLFNRLLIIVSICLIENTAKSYVISPPENNETKSQQTQQSQSIIKPIDNYKSTSNNVSILAQQINSTTLNEIQDEPSQFELLEQYWLTQRDAFFNATSFILPPATIALVGNEYAGSPAQPKIYHLPYWFDYEMFKNLTDRVHNDNATALKRHHIYIENCVSIWKSCALKRLHRPNNYTFIDHAEDWTQTENYNEEWGEISLNLTRAERNENPITKGVRLVREELANCAKRQDKNLCILLLIDLEERFGPSMKLRYPFEEERYRSLLDIDAAEEASAEFADSLLSSDGTSSYWLQRREQFFKNNTILLNQRVKDLVGLEYSQKTYHLPFWFDYEVFKRMVSRINETPQEELKSHHKYIDSCLEIWNDTATDRLGQLDYEAGGITSHVDIPARTCLYNCNPFDYDLTDEEIREAPVDKARRLVQDELENLNNDKKRTILLLVELEERFDFPRAKGMRYPFEQPEKSREDFWKYVEERDKAIADFVKTLS